MFILCRFALLEDRTLGRLWVDGKECWTVERPWLDNAPNISCIPAGLYKMERRDSPKFGPNVWEVCDVPGRSHILFHAGNRASDLQGCIAPGVGLRQDLSGVGSSKVALEIIEKVTEGIDKTEILIVEQELTANVFAEYKKGLNDALQQEQESAPEEDEAEA